MGSVSCQKPSMAKFQTGALVIRVQRGMDLVARDFYTSDPYVVIAVGDLERRTRVINSNCNPEWKEELTFSISDPFLPINLTIFDHDTVSKDDQMGRAEIDIKPYLQCMEVDLEFMPIGTVVRKVQPNRTNCLAEESKIILMDDNGKMVQDMVLRLKNVEKGEVEIQVEWVNFPGNKGLSSRQLDTFTH